MLPLRFVASLTLAAAAAALTCDYDSLVASSVTLLILCAGSKRPFGALAALLPLVLCHTSLAASAIAGVFALAPMFFWTVHCRNAGELLEIAVLAGFCEALCLASWLSLATGNRMIALIALAVLLSFIWGIKLSVLRHCFPLRRWWHWAVWVTSIPVVDVAVASIPGFPVAYFRVFHLPAGNGIYQLAAMAGPLGLGMLVCAFSSAIALPRPAAGWKLASVLAVYVLLTATGLVISAASFEHPSTQVRFVPSYSVDHQQVDEGQLLRAISVALADGPELVLIAEYTLVEGEALGRVSPAEADAVIQKRAQPHTIVLAGGLVLLEGTLYGNVCYRMKKDARPGLTGEKQTPAPFVEQPLPEPLRMLGEWINLSRTSRMASTGRPTVDSGYQVLFCSEQLFPYVAPCREGQKAIVCIANTKDFHFSEAEFAATSRIRRLHAIRMRKPFYYLNGRCGETISPSGHVICWPLN